MKGLWVSRFRRAFRRPPAELIHHGFLEMKALKDRFRGSPLRGLPDNTLPKLFGFHDVTELWVALAAPSFPILTKISPSSQFQELYPEEVERVKAAAGQAMDFTIDLLGSNKVRLKTPINWQEDFKTNVEWPLVFFRDIDVADRGRKSDIKVPWELSRLQWLTPVAQAYMLDGDKRYAAFVREVLLSWIEENPYGRGPNWAVTMEAAMRVFTWTWLFHVFQASAVWSDQSFRSRFLAGIYEHGAFCARYLENFGHNGNHLIADAGALVYLGEFFPENEETRRWGELGWSILVREIFRQVHTDGTDYEGSISYHRMVAELFLWPALYRKSKGKGVPELYYDRLRSMAEFTSTYIKPDGSAPLWGDADDGRPYIFGNQQPTYHGYLPNLIYLALGDATLHSPNADSLSEVLWALGVGVEAGGHEPDGKKSVSRAFVDGGLYVMSGNGDHIFIDCGPVGYGGRGGHGHNDCLSFEAVLNKVPLISDSGTFVYTEDFEWRNSFRSTSFHNTPCIDNVELNRFISKEELFSLHDDARPRLLFWKTDVDKDIFVGSHSGYERLGPGIRPVRTIVLDKQVHGLVIQDNFEGNGNHQVSIPFHFVPGTTFTSVNESQWHLSVGSNDFSIKILEHDEWRAEFRSGWISERYGSKVERPVLEFTREGPFCSLSIGIRPDAGNSDTIEVWMRRVLAASQSG